MGEGIDAMAGIAKHPFLAKRSYLLKEEANDELTETVLVRYMGISYESAERVYHYGEHEHHNHEVLFIDNGTYEGEVNGTPLSLESGEALIVGPGDRHADRCRPPLAYYTLWFRLRQVSTGEQIPILRPDLPAEQHIYREAQEQMRSHFTALLREEQSDGRFSLSLRQAMAQEVVWRLIDALPRESLNPVLLERTKGTELLFRLTRLFEKNLRAPLTVSAMAKALHMSTTALSLACRQLLGQSPGKLLAAHRMDRAANLLRYSTQSIKEIAAGLGFHDASHLIHAFRRYHGQTPGEYRRS